MAAMAGLTFPMTQPIYIVLAFLHTMKAEARGTDIERRDIN